MNEAIGAKGGKRDRRRSMIIERNKKEKLKEYQEEQEIRDLEKKVKKQQIYTLIKTLPIVIGGGTVKNMYDTAHPKPDKEEVNSRWRIKEYDADITHKTPWEDMRDRERKVLVLPTGQKVVVYVPVIVPEKVVKPDLTVDTPSPVEGKKVEKKQPDLSISEASPIIKKDSKKEVPKKENPKENSPQVAGIEEMMEDLEVTPYIERTLDFHDLDLDNLPDNLKERLQTLKSRKIIDELERQFKDVRYELRKVIYEYNVLVDEDKRIVLSKEAEVILDKLSEIIHKIEELKSKMQIEDLDKYDDNYLYTLIEDYLQEFRDGNLVEEIKDSPLYVLITQKLEELEEKRDLYDKKVSKKKDELEDKEERFDELKQSFYSIEKMNDDLYRFQLDQEIFLREIREKVANAVTESERVRYEFQGMNRMARRLMRSLTFQMFLPGPRFARGIAASSAAYLYFVNQIIRPNMVERRYRVITVKDYSRDIQNSILELEDAIHLLGKTSTQIDKMIKEISEKYKDYMDVVPECREMLSNLRKMQQDIEEKEYEMTQMKKQQELELEKNNAKVKTIGEYPVN